MHWAGDDTSRSSNFRRHYFSARKLEFQSANGSVISAVRELLLPIKSLRVLHNTCVVGSLERSLGLMFGCGMLCKGICAITRLAVPL